MNRGQLRKKFSLDLELFKKKKEEEKDRQSLRKSLKSFGGHYAASWTPQEPFLASLLRGAASGKPLPIIIQYQ